MLDVTSTTPSRNFSPRARRRADAQLYTPARNRRGARVSSRRPTHRAPRMSLRAAVVGIALVAGEMLLAPELARDSAHGGATARTTAQLVPAMAPGTAHVTASAGETTTSAIERAVIALIASLSEARGLAERSQQTVTVVLDPATGRLWRMTGDDPDAPLASDGTIPLSGRVTLASSAARPSFTFAPDDAQADSVWVRDGTTRVAVVLDPRSGEPRANR